MTRRKSAQNTRNCTAQWSTTGSGETGGHGKAELWLCGGPNHFDSDGDGVAALLAAVASERPTKVDNMWIFLVTFEFI